MVELVPVRSAANLYGDTGSIPVTRTKPITFHKGENTMGLLDMVSSVARNHNGNVLGDTRDTSSAHLVWECDISFPDFPSAGDFVKELNATWAFFTVRPITGAGGITVGLTVSVNA